MSIPADVRITWELLCLLHMAPSKGMEVRHVYKVLAEKFPELTHEEMTVPYKSDEYGSKWNTAVRSVREKCKKAGLVSTSTGRGYWALTDKGHKAVVDPLDISGLD